MLIPRQGPALTMPSGKGELLAGGIKRFGPLLGDVVFSGEEGVGEGGGGIKVPSFSGGSGSGVLLGIGIGVGAGVGMGAYTGSLMGLGKGTFEVTGAGLDNPGVGMIMVEVGGMFCVSTEGALRR